MSVQASPYLSGRLLVAMPGIGDPRFERAVILLCEHDQSHAMGLTVNRPVDGLTISSLLGKLGVDAGPDAADALVLLGGPVDTERGFVLHTCDRGFGAGSLRIGEDLALTVSRDILQLLARPAERPRRSVMAVGYAGWDGGQLEREIRENVWLICEADEDLLFDDDHEHKWSRALAKIGVSPENLSAHLGRA